MTLDILSDWAYLFSGVKQLKINCERELIINYILNCKLLIVRIRKYNYILSYYFFQKDII